MPIVETLATLQDLQETDEERLKAHFEPLAKFQSLDEASQQHFLTYLKNINSIDVVEGEEILSAFELLTSQFDEHLYAYMETMLQLDKSQQLFQKRVLKRKLVEAKL